MIMASNETPIAKLASVASTWFEAKCRENGETFLNLRDDRPEWLLDLVRDAHNGMLPDDWKYAAILSALDSIGEGYSTDEEHHEWCDGEVDVYNNARSAWLASHLDRAGYCDAAKEEGLADGSEGIFDLIGIGQYQELREIFGFVWDSLTERLEAEEEDPTAPWVKPAPVVAKPAKRVARGQK